MQGSNLFEYAVIRYVPRPDREEFVNVGVILYCASMKFLHMKYTIREERICAFHPDADIGELNKILEGMQEVCCGSSVNSPVAKYDIASRFRWLTATRSTIIQTSKVHPGFCEDPMEKLESLMKGNV